MNRLLASFHGPNHKWWALGTVQTGVLISTLDAGIVAVSLPSIMSQFQTTVTMIQWVVLAYLMMITVTLLPFGRLADIYGRKQIYTLGFAIFTVGSALCGISGDVLQLVAFRAFQALGASMLMANGMAITSAVFPPTERGKALGIGGTVVAIGTTIGPTVGGLLTQWLGWRFIFLVNIPIGIVGIAMAATILRNRLITPTLTGPRPKFDLAGAAIAAVGLMALLSALMGSEQMGLPESTTLLLYTLSIVSFVLFIAVEHRVSEPMIDLRLFHQKAFALGSFSGLLSFLAISANSFLLPFYLQLILHFSPGEAGLLMTPSSLMLAVVAPVSGWLSDKIGARFLSSMGLATASLSLFLLSRLDTTSGYGEVLLWLLLLGAGQGMFQSPNNSAVIGSVPRERYGIAGGFLSMMRNLGMVMGTAISGTLLAGGLVSTSGHVNLSILSDAAARDTTSVVAGFMVGMEHAYLAAAAMSALGILVSLSRGGSFRGGSNRQQPATVSETVLSGSSDGAQ